MELIKHPLFLLLLGWVLTLIGDKYIKPILPEVDTIGNSLKTFKNWLLKILVIIINVLTIVIFPLFFILNGISNLCGFDVIHYYSIRTDDLGDHSVFSIFYNILWLINGLLMIIVNYSQYKRKKVTN